MGLLTTARKVDALYGGTFDTFRGPVPRSLLSYWTACECGGDRFAVSKDPVLIECGLSQAPLVRARQTDVDPFDGIAGCWLAGYEACHDYEQYAQVASGRDVLYLVLLNYSVGQRAVQHVMALCEYYRHRAPTVEGRALWVAKNCDLTIPPHVAYWGRQSGTKVAERLVKQSKRLDAAATLGPLDGPPGPLPMGLPPADAKRFPPALANAAMVCADRNATTAAHARAHEDVRAYARAMRRAAKTRLAPLFYRARVLLGWIGTDADKAR